MELGSTGIQLVSETRSYWMFARDNLLALVERTSDGYGGIGSTGILTERGLAYLVWRDGQAFLAGKGFELQATDNTIASTTTIVKRKALRISRSYQRSRRDR